MPIQTTIASRINAIALNLWWSWNPSAQQLFASLDPQLWTATRNNPIKTLKLLSPERRELIETDPAFAHHVEAVEKELHAYLKAPTWFGRTQKKAGRKKIGYFCFEFAVHECMQNYSGGLGVLAGDHVKSASDLGLPFAAVGLVYKNGFYTHEFARDGSTRVIYPKLDFSDFPLIDTRKTVTLDIGASKVKVKIWKMVVGRANLYLMDTDVEGNKPADRALTRHLYGGDSEVRIRQELLLGVGGLKVFEAVGHVPDVLHLNEGHAAFAALERYTKLVKSGKSPDHALRRTRSGTVFTTHTPVPAGHDRFEPKLALKYLGRYASELKITPAELLAFGREDPTSKSESFCMTVLALKLASHCNGVAKLNGEVSRKMWQDLFRADNPDAVPIGHVTNGIHSPTWLAPEARPFYAKHLKSNFINPTPTDDPWAKITKVPDADFWALRNMLRAKLVHFIRQRLIEQIARGHGPVEEYQKAYQTFDSNTLTIGFARRFATYKRAPLIFRDARRLARILQNPKGPMQIVFAGKAHPKDLGGQAFAKQIYLHAKEAAFEGRVVILEDYDMSVGRALTSGADVWLNNPLRPHEASGTSGMKPPLHGGINCSILDGWWPEAYDGKNGWAIGGKEFADQEKQDTYDAASIYSLLENELRPTFYQRDRSGIPRQWVAMMKASMRSVCQAFSTHRMVAEYLRKYYLPAMNAK